MAPMPPIRVSSRRQRLLIQTRNWALPGVAEVFRQGLVLLETLLLDQVEDAGGGQAYYFEAIQALGHHRQLIEGQFCQHLTQAWQGLVQGPLLSAQVVLTGHRPDADLRLLEELELEFQLALVHFANVMTNTCRAALIRLNHALSMLASAPQLSADTNPLSAEHCAVAIHAGFAQCDLSPKARLLLTRLCERVLIDPLHVLYLEIESCLAESGLVPPWQVAVRPSTQAGQRAHDQPNVDRLLHAIHPRPDAAAPHLAERLVQRWEQSRECIQNSQRVRVATSPDEWNSEQRAVFFNDLHTTLAQQRHAQAASLKAPKSDQRPLSHGEMLSILSLMQASKAAFDPVIDEGQEPIKQRLKNEILSGASRYGVDPQSTDLDPLDEDAIDLVGMLFDRLLAVSELVARGRDLITRLAVPMVKVALLDRNVFVQKSHPARRLLNLLTQACEGNRAQTPTERLLISKAEEVIERLVGEFNENFAIFSALEEEFREFLNQHQRRIDIAERRAAETQRGQEKLAVARVNADQTLKDYLQRYPALPATFVDFFQRPWRHYLTLSLLREADQKVAAEAMLVADFIVNEWHQARQHQGYQPNLKPIRALLSKVFASIGLHGEVAQAACAALQETLSAVAEGRPDLERALPDMPHVQLPMPPNDRIEITVPAQQHVDDVSDAEIARFARVAVGDWLDFLDQDGKVQAGKVSWISPLSGHLLFVNRQGGRLCVASPKALALMMRCGRLREHVDSGAFEHALQHVMDRLSPQSAAIH